MSFEKVREFFKSKNLEDRIVLFDDSTATVKLAAEKLNVKESQIAKTLAFKDEKENQALLIVALGDRKIDNRKFKETFKQKAKMLSREELLELVGHEAGGVCPFVVKDSAKIYLDESLHEEEVIYPAAGSVNSTVRLSLEELEGLLEDYQWIDVTKK
ncbi:MAG: YbaK/EbsC family protein [Peptoniphilus sp.]|nr:YbaK/EbsC family protein [Peptoniphilus sp.]